MTDLLSAFKGLSGLVGKGLVIELFLEYYEGEFIDGLKTILDTSSIQARDMPDYVLHGKALPIPAEAFIALKGLEDYLKTIEPARVFEWLAKARPDLANELIKLEDLGAEYIVRFKGFMIDSIKASSVVPKEEKPEETEPAPKMKKVTCESCGAVFTMTEEEASKLESCPNCGE